MLSNVGALSLTIATASAAAVPREAHGFLPQPRLVSTLDLPSVAVLDVADHYGGLNGPQGLLVTTFKPQGEDGVYVVRNLPGVFNGTATPTLETITMSVVWPNQAVMAPYNASREMPEGVLVAGGFFVSEKKATGTVSMFDVNGKELKISTDEKDFFYHQAEFVDIDGDGLQDVLAARTHKTLIGKATTEMIWMKQPAQAGQPWTTTVLINDGPGVAFAVVDLDNDGKNEIVATEFFAQQDLAIYSCPAMSWSQCSPSNVERVVIADGDGSYFNVEWVDLNGDGKKDLLATNNGKDGSVFAYEQPANWRTMPWGRHVISTGEYKPTMSYLPGRGSPGIALSFRTSSDQVKPRVLVSADDGGFVMLLQPMSDTLTNDWSYNATKFYTGKGTIGTPAVGDLDRDGYTDAVFIPDFANGKLVMYSYL